jgi:hypothetical protein
MFLHMLPFELVAHTGFEPVISTLRGWHPRPLDECAVALISGQYYSKERPSCQIRAIRRKWRRGVARPRPLVVE